MKNIKKIKVFIMVLLSVLTFNACSDLDDAPQTGATTAPELTDPESGNTYVLTAEAASNTFEVYSWSSAKWSDVSIPASYTIEIALAGTDFAKTAIVATANACPFRVKVSEMNTAIAGLGIKKAEATDLEMRLIANPINENAEIITVWIPYTLKLTH